MNFMIANPTAPLGVVAREFEVTQPWLSCIIHSNAFKTKLREKQELMFGNLAATITEKLEAVAHTTLDNLLEHVSASNSSPAANLEIADKVLHRLGYAPKSGPQPAAQGAQVNIYNVTSDDLAHARTLIASRNQPQGAEIQALEYADDARSEGGFVGGNLNHATPVSP